MAAHTLFIDERQALNAMLSDGINFDTAINAITKKRKDILSRDINREEVKELQEIARNDMKIGEAMQKIRDKRYDKLPIWKKIGKTGFDTTVGFLKNATNTVGKVGEYTADTIGADSVRDYLKEETDEINKITKRTTGDSTASKVGSVVFDVGLGASMPTKFAPKGTGLGSTALRGAYYTAPFGALDEVREKGSEAKIQDMVTRTAQYAGIGAVGGVALEKVAAPVLGAVASKGFKYGTAGIKGGVKGLGKSIGRDVKNTYTGFKTGLGDKSQNIATSLSTKINRFTKGNIQKFEKLTGETPGQWAVNRGMNKVGDEAVEEATNLYIKSMKEADKGMEAIAGKFTQKTNNDAMGQMLDDLVARLKNTNSNDANKFSNLLKEYKTEGLTMKDINEVKRAYSKNFKYTFVDNASENAIKSSNLQNQVREWQMDLANKSGFKNLREINKNTQGWKNYADMLAREVSGKSGNNAISLTDWVALSGGSPTNIGMFLGKQMGKLDSIKKLGIKTFGKQTKPNIIEANTNDILKANQLKNASNNNILYSGTSSKSGNIGLKNTVNNKNLSGVKYPSPKGSNDIIPNVSKKANNLVKKDKNGVLFYRKADGSKIEYKKGAYVRNRDFKNSQFKTDYKFKLNNTEKKYVGNLKMIQTGKVKKGPIAKLSKYTFKDKKKRFLEMTTEIYEKIFKKHGPFRNENFIKTANNRDYMIKDLNGVEGHINLIKKIPNSDKGFLIGARRENGAFVTTHFEPKNNISLLLKKAKSNGGKIFDGNSYNPIKSIYGIGSMEVYKEKVIK